MVDIWQEGWDAQTEGKEWTDNPYPEFNDKRFDEWDLGFGDAETTAGYVDNQTKD